MLRRTYVVTQSMAHALPKVGPPATLIEAARRAQLRYVSDVRPGITRKRRGKHFRYLSPNGRPISKAVELQRLRKLAIPPAWREVWICPDPSGHLLATGRDARGRKQYRYHPRFRQVRDETKYHRMIAFGLALPRIRACVARDLALPGLPRVKVLATVLRLLEVTLIRVGNEEYARANRSFGLTTLRDRHVRTRGARLRFEFRGKSGIDHAVELHDRRLARIVKQCRDLPGQELFQYLDDDGMRHSIGSADVNEYLRAISADDFSAKDFRTWAGTVLAAQALRAFAPFESEGRAKRNVVEAIEAVAKTLGNTRSVCRKCYVHPAVLEAYLDGSLVETLRARARRLRALRKDEGAVLAFLQHKLAGTKPRSRGRKRAGRGAPPSRERAGIGERALRPAARRGLR